MVRALLRADPAGAALARSHSDKLPRDRSGASGPGRRLCVQPSGYRAEAAGAVAGIRAPPRT